MAVVADIVSNFASALAACGQGYTDGEITDRPLHVLDFGGGRGFHRLRVGAAIHAPCWPLSRRRPWRSAPQSSRKAGSRSLPISRPLGSAATTSFTHQARFNMFPTRSRS
jgi:hypothetical protein